MLFISPLKIFASKARQFILNLNQYRNTHYRTLNSCKINYKEVMKSQINKSKKFGKVLCVYTVYAGSKRNFDIGNVCSIHEKFFEDALVELGKLEDDNFNFIPLVIYKTGGIDKENPRVEIEVLPWKKESIDKIVEMLYTEYSKEEGNEV